MTPATFPGAAVMIVAEASRLAARRRVNGQGGSEPQARSLVDGRRVRAIRLEDPGKGASLYGSCEVLDKAGTGA